MGFLPIIFVHKGDSFYLKYALQNAKKFNPNSRIILIGEGVTEYPDFVEYYRMEDYSVKRNKFISVYKHLSTNSEIIERFCFERWFVLNEFLSKQKIPRCLTVDSDVLLFEDVTKDSKNYSKYAFTLSNKSSGGFMFINSVKAIESFCTFVYNAYTDKKLKHVFFGWYENYKKTSTIGGGVNDMLAFEEYYKASRQKIGDITDIINGATYDAMINNPQKGFEMDGILKKVVFENGLPYAFFKGKKVRMKCLHFQGPTKFFMKCYSSGNSSSLCRNKALIMTKLRDSISPVLPSSARNFIKKAISKLGF